MASGWNVYYIVVLAGLLALLVPVALWVISRALSPRAVAPSASVSLIQSENPAAVGRKSNPRLFQALNASLVLILLALLMIPCAVTLPGNFGLVCILSFSVIAGLALLYGVRKQDLDWLKTYREVNREARK
jgi:NADH:ubiquinone oxidoreductase subunit 3 (subunit A)